MDPLPASPFPRPVLGSRPASHYRLRAVLLEFSPVAATALAGGALAFETSGLGHVNDALGGAFLFLCWWPSGIGWFLTGRPLQGGAAAIIRWASVGALFVFAIQMFSYIDCGAACHPDARPLIGAFVAVCVWPIVSAGCLAVTLIAEALLPTLPGD